MHQKYEILNKETKKLILHKALEMVSTNKPKYLNYHDKDVVLDTHLGQIGIDNR